MRKESDIDFVSLLEDETFIGLVKDTEGLENQLGILEKEFSGQKGAIANAVQFIRANLSEQKNMPMSDFVSIWQNIGEYADQRDRKIKSRFIGHRIWKVAAALVIIIATSAITYHWLIDKDPLEKIAAIKTIIDDEAMIILSDGSKHKLSVNESRIAYSPDGGEIVVEKDKQEEKLENINSSKSITLNQIIVPYGHRHAITLSDGTRVQLNSGSRLIFPASFSGKDREVYLKGEGYFEVSKNPERLFIVKTDFINIRVLGTVFNISAYEEEGMTTTVLVEGRVIIAQKNRLIGYTERQLKPGQGCFYSTSNLTSEIRGVHVCEYTSWKDGILLFKDKPLKEVVARVEKYYNKKIFIKGDKLSNTLISGKLVLSDDINMVMVYLAKTLEARYGKNEDGYLLMNN